MPYYRFIASDGLEYGSFEVFKEVNDSNLLEPGWYYALGFPGCLWDSDPIGPFPSEEAAVADARATGGE